MWPKMSTGDLKNNLRKLQVELKLVKIEKDVDMENLAKGLAAAFLPIYHYVFLDYSHPLAELIANINIDMYGKSDLKFLESMYKVLRELFSYKPPVTKEQFFSGCFIERKIIMCTEVLGMVREKHKSMGPKTGPRSAPRRHTSSPAQPPVRVASARPAAACSSPLPVKDKEDSRLNVEGRKLTNLRRSHDVYYGPRLSDADSDTVPRVVNELLHTSHAASNGNKIDTHVPNSSQSGTCVGTHLRACSGATDQHTDNIHPHLSGACYNPSRYVQSAESNSNGLRHNTGDKRTPIIITENDSPVLSVGEIGALTADLKYVLVRRGRGDESGDMLNAGYIREGDPAHSRMSVASMMRFAPSQVLESSHSDKTIVKEMDAAPIHGQVFPTPASPDIQETLESIMQIQRDLIARVISLENSMACVNKTEVGLDRPEVDTAHLENIFARLTLLENRMADMDCKKGTNLEMLHLKSTNDEKYDSVRLSPKLRCSNGVMDMSSPGKDDLAEGDYTHLSDSVADPAIRINEILKEAEQMLDNNSTGSFN